MWNQPERASTRLPTWLTRHHGQPAPPFCASQEAAPSILCLPSLTRSSLLHLVSPFPHKKQPAPFCASQEADHSILCLLSLTGSSPFHIVPLSWHPPLFCAFPPSQKTAPSILCLPQAWYQEGWQPWHGSGDVRAACRLCGPRGK